MNILVVILIIECFVVVVVGILLLDDVGIKLLDFGVVVFSVCVVVFGLVFGVL